MNSPHAQKPPPKGWPRIASSVFYEDASAAIDFLVRAFGFKVELRIDGPDGKVAHSQLSLDGGLVMVGQTGGRIETPYRMKRRSPKTASGVVTQVLCVCVDDVDAHCEHAKAAGAKVLEVPSTQDYGEDYWADRTWLAEDPEGHQWYFLQRLREPKG